jgi:hypothetical protein
VRDASFKTTVSSTAFANISSYIDETTPTTELSSGEETPVPVEITTQQTDVDETGTPTTGSV